MTRVDGTSRAGGQTGNDSPSSVAGSHQASALLCEKRCCKRRNALMKDSNENARTRRPREHVSRRRFLQETAGTFGAVLGTPGIYKMIETIADPPDRPAMAASPPLQEQYLLQNEQVVNVNPLGVKSRHGTIAVRVPALYDHVITAKLNVSANAKELQEAQHHLESVLLDLEHQFPPTPTGVGTTVAWGLPYFQHYAPSLGKTSSFFKAGTAYPTYL